jgi:hypothetical protein
MGHEAHNSNLGTRQMIFNGNHLRRIWCYLRNHPYPWVLICEPEDWPFNSMPPSKCSNCGCTSR